MKTVVIGLDALDFRYVDRFADATPNLQRLRERGLEARLESTHPPWTGSAWPSMYTGTDPSHHGVYGFFAYDGYPDEAQLVSRTDVRKPALWEYLSHSRDGGRSVVMNVPVTHPAEPIEGALVPGYLAVEDEPGHPEGIRDELSAAIGEEYTIYSRAEVSDDKDAKFEGYLDLIERRRRAAVELVEREEWELAVLQVQKTDAVFHNFERDEAFRRIYAAADRLVGDVLEAVDDDAVNVVVCSDHGIGPVTGYNVHVNEVLRDHGFVETTDETDRPTIGTEKASLVEGNGSGGPGPSQGPGPVDDGAEPARNGDNGSSPLLEGTVRAGQRLASRVGVEPADVYAAAERVGLESTLLRLAPDAVKSAATESVDWRNSRAYCADGTRMGVRINVAGREPDGVVPQSAYESTREEIIEILSALETPNGEPVFEYVCRREDLYDGPYVDRAPDVCFLPTDMNHLVSSTLYGRQFVSVDTYNHKRDGVFIGAGPAFSASGPDRFSLTDVAPIAMALLDRPVPERMTGSVPPGVLSADVRRSDYGDIPYGRATVEPTADDGEVTERLEDLGYL
ncbi:Type I phosphodiesterase / nucleotide pyrophosphatase [Halobiforma haloterrestris]|uniref:Type I phosphodiesterase / nucleotide pyrophosphatase n=1 Tax=Natronobacterium haloterrestre TaxID=148448 RepID=A0A1I1F770_NATHA|nr:alkaline phosphatase family protein [Halobiforma haloterrestris]SFB92993.1 Type I phosphodiesterase / nucleotide pyrophosphatase [Halobiforma haloterrestris]